MTIRLIAVLLLFLFSAGCERNEPSYTIRTDGGDIFFSGRITSAAADSVIEEIGGARRLIIFSNGGDVDAAIRIGHAVIEGSVTVEVDTLCASSCAHYIFAVAPAKVIREQSAVIFHTSPFTWEHLLSNGYIRSPDIESSNKRHLSELTALYQKAGVSTGVLVCASRLIEVRPETARIATGGGAFVSTEYSGVYFGRGMLEQFGIDNVSQAYDFTDGERLAFKLDGKFVRVARQGDCASEMNSL